MAMDWDTPDHQMLDAFQMLAPLLANGRLQAPKRRREQQDDDEEEDYPRRQPNMMALLRMMATLVIRHDRELSMRNTEDSFICFLGRDEQGLLTAMLKTAQDWRANKTSQKQPADAPGLPDHHLGSQGTGSPGAEDDPTGNPLEGPVLAVSGMECSGPEAPDQPGAGSAHEIDASVCNQSGGIGSASGLDSPLLRPETDSGEHGGAVKAAGVTSTRRAPQPAHQAVQLCSVAGPRNGHATPHTTDHAPGHPASADDEGQGQRTDQGEGQRQTPHDTIDGLLASSGAMPMRRWLPTSGQFSIDASFTVRIYRGSVQRLCKQTPSQSPDFAG